MQQSKSKSNNPKAETLVIRGVEVNFSNLKEPKGFNDSDENRKYTLTAKVSGPQVAELQKTLEDVLDKAHQFYAAELPKAEQKRLVKSSIPTTDVYDDQSNETGEVVIKTKRNERMGPPPVLGKDKKPVDRAFLGRGSIVDLSVALKPYKMSGTVGISLVLQGVLIVEEKEYVRKSPTAEDLGFIIRKADGTEADISEAVF